MSFLFASDFLQFFFKVNTGFNICILAVIGNNVIIAFFIKRNGFWGYSSSFQHTLFVA